MSRQPRRKGRKIDRTSVKKAEACDIELINPPLLPSPPPPSPARFVSKYASLRIETTCSIQGRRKKERKKGGEKKGFVISRRGLHEDSIFPDALRANMKTRLFGERDSGRKKRRKKKRIISQRRAIKNGGEWDGRD